MARHARGGRRHGSACQGKAAACLTKAAEAGGMARHGGGMRGEGCRGRRHGSACQRWAAAWRRLPKQAACVAKAAEATAWCGLPGEGSGMGRHSGGDVVKDTEAGGMARHGGGMMRQAHGGRRHGGMPGEGSGMGRHGGGMPDKACRERWHDGGDMPEAAKAGDMAVVWRGMPGEGSGMVRSRQHDAAWRRQRDEGCRCQWHTPSL